MIVARRHSVGRYLLGFCGAYQIALGTYFILRPSLLPEDVRFARISLEELPVAAPGLEAWLAWVFTVMGGQMAGVGLLLVWIAVYLNPERMDRWQAVMLIGAGLLTVGTMSVVNFQIGSDFRWLLIAPVLAWILAVGFIVSKAAARKQW